MLCKFMRTLCFLCAVLVSLSFAFGQEQKPRSLRRPPAKAKWWVGGSLSYWYLLQGQRTLNAPGGEIYSISSLTSTTQNIHGFLAIPIPKKFTIVPYVALKTTQFRGDSTLQGLSDSRTVKLDQSLMSLGTYLKYRFKSGSRLWWGFGGELAKGTAVKLNVGGQNYSTTSADLPFFLIANGHLGYDIPLNNGFIFSPETRVGVAANTQPIILSIEFLASTAYRF